MRLLDSISVNHQGCERKVMLLAGDLAHIPKQEAVDVVIVSAFPDDYIPSPNTLIRDLERRNVSVGQLAKNKAVDLRTFSSCWLSHPIEHPDIHFRRILCFEPRYRGKAPEVVGDIFRSIVPFTTGKPPITQIAMPLVAAGNQRESPEVMLEALTDASVHWLSAGLPLDRIKIVILESADSPCLREAFARVKRRYDKSPAENQNQKFAYDVFVSYSHNDRGPVDELVGELRARESDMRIFVDRLALQAGAAWQQHIFMALDASRKVVCMLSPDYLASKVCQDEFNMALFRHREATEGVLIPIYLYSAQLPTYMKLIQYEDAREGDRIKIAKVAEHVIKQL